MATLQDGVLEDAQAVLGLESEALRRFQTLLGPQLSGMRIRCHGDYHLGQVLFTGKDFVIIDFEGEPTRPLSQRRLKRSPLVDVAGMLRSFSYAADTALFNELARGTVPPERTSSLEAWARMWQAWVSSAFLNEYLKTVGDAGILPKSREELSLLLRVLLLEKALYEVGYELNNRPDWLRIPLRGVLSELTPSTTLGLIGRHFSNPLTFHCNAGQASGILLDVGVDACGALQAQALPFTNRTLKTL
jgi:maltose alpha-D-glucosyltransferase/alpha-amylase